MEEHDEASCAGLPECEPYAVTLGMTGCEIALRPGVCACQHHGQRNHQRDSDAKAYEPHTLSPVFPEYSYHARKTSIRISRAPTSGFLHQAVRVTTIAVVAF